MPEKLNMKYFVSVIIPCYNAEKYIEQAIESALNQTHKYLELIIINDGSTDVSEELIIKYCNLDSRVKYFSQQNKGVSFARNEGIKKAVGEFIAFLDADDVWEPENVEKKIKVLNEYKTIDWVFSDMYLADEMLNKTGIREGRDNGNLLNSLLLRKGEIIGVPSNIIVRSSCFEVIDISFDTNLSTSADWDFCLQLLSKGFSCKRVPLPLWSYRVHEDSMSHNVQTLQSDNLYVLRKAQSQIFFKSFWFKQQCFSNTYLILAGCWWVNGHNKTKGFYFIIKSILFYPPNILKLLKKMRPFKLTRVI